MGIKFWAQPCPRCRGNGYFRQPQTGELRRIRERSGLTLTEIARRLGFTVGYLCDIERGRRAVTDEILAVYEGLL